MGRKKHRNILWYCMLLWISLATSCTTTPSATSTPEQVQATSITGAMATLTATSYEVTVGKTLVIDVMIENVNALYGMELQLQFNPEQLEVVDANAEMEGIQVAHGNFLDVQSSYIQNQVDNTTGTIKYYLTQMAPAEPASGKGSLITVVLRGKDTGALNISITNLLLSDANGKKIPVTILQQE